MGRKRKYSSEEEKREAQRRWSMNIIIEIEQYFKQKLGSAIVGKGKWN